MRKQEAKYEEKKIRNLKTKEAISNSIVTLADFLEFPDVNLRRCEERLEASEERRLLQPPSPSLSDKSEG